MSEETTVIKILWAPTVSAQVKRVITRLGTFPILCVVHSRGTTPRAVTTFSLS